MAISNLRSSMRTIMRNIIIAYLAEHLEVTMESSDDEIEEVENPMGAGPTHLQNSRDLTIENCRICYGAEDAPESDPTISIGCHCTGDISYGHKSCLIKWFRTRLLRLLEVTCEVCKGPVGRTLQSTLLKRHIQDLPLQCRMPSELILLQVPIEDLDQLQVPIDTPAFDTLDPDTQEAIDKILHSQYEKHKGEVKARGQTVLEMVAKESDCPLQIARVRRGCELLEEYIEMVIVQQPNPPKQCAFFPRSGDPPNIKIVEFTQSEDVLRVPAASSVEGVVNALSQELALNVFQVVINMSRTEQLILLPRLMIVDAIYTDKAPEAPFLAPLGQVKGVSSPRHITYGIYQMFSLA